ncbi:alpha/beta fold hydrolase [Agromyces sp. Marseille-P2726]|uniref:alpha/beta fold hydrolase n=1 Tax=Agromyces sp. Marseille-P2726 TaxID=2709132 RepID=UPI00157139DC|nr:alpha/beta hydrolase [Agromyces sp. Marseille-P2726]
MTFTLSTPSTDVVRRNNVTMSGSPTGRPIVFVHGFGCSQEMWRHVVPHFESDHRVVLLDLVGAGGSDVTAYDPIKYDSLHGYADDVLEILEALDLRDVVFVGHSVAATIGVLAETTDPSRFGSLVLVGPSPRYIDDEDYRGGFEREDIEGLLDALDANYLGWSESMAPVIMGNTERPELGRQLSDSFCSVDPEIARHFARVTFLSDNRRDFSGVRTPTLVLQCSDDVIAPTSVGRYVHEQIPTSRFVQLSATGHCPNLSAPDELADEIRAFLS